MWGFGTPVTGSGTKRLMSPLTRLLETAVALPFQVLSGLRGRRIFHPYGIAFDATVDVTDPQDNGTELFGSGGRRRAIVRISGGAGVPRPLPDNFGIALRVLDAYGGGQHQDLMMNVSGTLPVARHLLLPAFTVTDGHYSTVLPYRIGTMVGVVGARPVLADAAAAPATLEDFADEAGAGRLRFELLLASLVGPWRRVGDIELGGRLPDGVGENLAFNPWNTGGGIVPLGFFNRLRRSVYDRSQAGRNAGTPIGSTTEGARAASGQ